MTLPHFDSVEIIEYSYLPPKLPYVNTYLNILYCYTVYCISF